MSDDIPVRAADLERKYKHLRDQLTLLVDNPTLTADQKDLVRGWRFLIDAARNRAFSPLSIAFLSAVGRGKSSLIAAATGLRVETPNLANPRTWSVLPVAAGRTTLGEILIEFDSHDKIVLQVEPLSARALETEVRIFAEDQFEAAHRRKGTGAEKSQPGEELAKLLKNWLAPSAEDPHLALRAEAEMAETSESLEKQWLARIDFDVRCKAFEESFPSTPDGLQELKKRLAALMKGTLANAPVPAKTRIATPAGELAFRVGSIVDTQGIDDEAKAWIKGRSDIVHWITHNNSLLVVCSAFEDAPDPVSRSLLQTIQEIDGANALREHALRLFIIDKRQKEDDDSEELAKEQRQRVQECRDKLRRDGIELPDHAVVVVDVREDATALRAELNAMAAEGRSWRLNALQERLDSIESTLGSLHDVAFAARAYEIDLRLWWEWDAEVVRTRGPHLDGFAALGRDLPNYTEYYWSQMHASVRRRGHYHQLDLAQVGSRFAADDAVAVYTAAVVRLRVEAARIAREDTSLAQHVAMRVEEFAAALRTYRETVKLEWQRLLTDYFASAKSNDLWTWCVNRWGGGKGYLAEVIQRIGQESEKAQLRLAITDDIGEHLPKRPTLFSLRKMTLTNFRGIQQRSHELGQTSVFIGDNGHGKTGWLEAIAATIGTFLPGVGAGPAPLLSERDVREVLKRMGDRPDRQPQLPMQIEVDAIIEGAPLTWSRRIDSLPVTEAQNTDDALQIKARKAGEEIRGHSMRQLPVLVYYGTQRLWPPDVDPKSDVGSNRLDGYRDCLNPASTQNHLFGWMKKFTFVELQRKKQVPQLQAIRNAVVTCIDGAKDFRYEVELEEFILEMKNGDCARFATLSDGYRNMVAMVADIAWRASVLNPQLLDRAAKYAEGVVLIDEIDLHLHPKWQRRVLADLRRVFPRLQFIATTHSPFIVQSLEPGQLVNLDDETNDAPYANESPEDIVENLMGVELPQRSERRKNEYEAAKRYYDLLEKVPAADPVELAKLKAELDEAIAPYADNQALVAFLELQRLAAEAKRT